MTCVQVLDNNVTFQWCLSPSMVPEQAGGTTVTHYFQIIAAAIALTLSGCATTIEIPAEQSLDEAFGEIKNSSSTVYLRGGATMDADSAIAEGDSLTVWEDGDPVTFPLREVYKVSTRSTGAGILQGLGIGFLTGAGIGALTGFSEGDDPPAIGWHFSFTAEEKAVLLGGGLGIIMGVAGAIAGGIIGQHTDYELHRAHGLETDPPEPGATGIVRGGESGDDTSIVTITVPRLESEDEVSIVFYWNGKLEWLPKARITMEEVPEGVKISMPQSLREHPEVRDIMTARTRAV